VHAAHGAAANAGGPTSHPPPVPHGLVLIGGLECERARTMDLRRVWRPPAEPWRSFPGGNESVGQVVGRRVAAGSPTRRGRRDWRKVAAASVKSWRADVRVAGRPFHSSVVERGRSAVSTEVGNETCTPGAPAAGAYLAQRRRTLNAARLGTARRPCGRTRWGITAGLAAAPQREQASRARPGIGVTVG